jgi:signal peptidase I
MEPTLLVGDHLLVNKFIFGGRGQWYDAIMPYRAVRRGDIIVFKFPYQDHPHYVKRVIGLPGDRVKIVEKQLFVNGEKMQDSHAYYDSSAPYDPFLYNFPPAGRDELLPNMQPEWIDEIFDHVRDGELIVPANKYFAMGDNRDHSWDSRYWGFVDREAIMGRPVVIYWSLETSEDFEEPSPFGGIVNAARALIRLPARTRWGRMLHTLD